MHRLVGALIQQEARDRSAELETALLAHADSRAQFLAEAWLDHKHRWEIDPLVALASQLIGQKRLEGARLADQIFVPLQALGRTSEARDLAQLSVRIREEIMGRSHPALATSYSNLALVEGDFGNLGASEELFRKALAIDEQNYSPDHPRIANNLNNLATLLQRLGRYAEAEPLVRRALVETERILGPEAPDFARSLNNLGVLLNETGRSNEAEEVMRRALSIDERVLGASHPQTARDLFRLSQLYIQSGELGEAEPLMRRSLAILEECLGPEHRDTMEVIPALAWLLLLKGDYQAAEALTGRILDFLQRATDDMLSPKTAIVLNNIAMVFCKNGWSDRAVPLLMQALHIDEKLLGQNHPKIPHRLNNLSMALIMQNQISEAKKRLTRAGQLKSGQHDLTSARILFVRLAVALLDLEPAESFVGQLKILLSRGLTPDFSGVSQTWDVAFFTEHLRPLVSPDSADLLTAIAQALNETSDLASLNRFPIWQAQPSLPVDIPNPIAVDEA
jgi:tetratricopeptide (TPR) repeat protein